MKLLLLSDIHGNAGALTNVLELIEKNYSGYGLVLLGDLIDYGMHSNDVVLEIQRLSPRVLCSIRGNHEDAIIRGDYTRFSSERGRECARYTRSVLHDSAWRYITDIMAASGSMELTISGKKCLAVHGSLEDAYWDSIKPEMDLSAYQKYDYVFSGHSHLPHYFEKFYHADDPEYRNKKKTVFINPGSVGQPRNHTPLAQFAALDMGSGEVNMIRVPYDIAAEQAAYRGQVDDFYRKRLEVGV